MTYLCPGHFANDVYDAGVHNNGGGAGCIPDRCSSTLSRTSAALTLRAHFHKTIPLAPARIAVTSRYLEHTGTRTHGNGQSGTAPVGL